MAFFEWDDSIALGIPTIDQQHKAIFDWINTLNEAIKSGDGRRLMYKTPKPAKAKSP